MMIGAPDMALPRMNNWSFWILPFAFAMLASTLFTDAGAPNFGWTFYAPLSTTYAPETVTFFIFGVHLMGMSSIMGSINIIATILNMRAPGMTLHEDADVRLDLVHHRLPADRRDAGAGGCGHDDAVRHPLRHQLLQCGRWR